MTILNNSHLAAGAAVVAALVFCGATTAEGAVTGWNQTAAGTYDYNTRGNWVDIDNDGTGDVNGIWDSSLAIEGGQAITFAADTQVTAGLAFSHEGNYPVALTSLNTTARTLALGGDIAVTGIGGTAANITIGDSTNVLNVDLGGATRACTVRYGRTLAFANVLSEGGVTVTGLGTVRFDAANLFTGPTTVNSGTLVLNSAGSIAGSDVTINSRATLSMTNGTGPVTRAKSIAMDGSCTLAADESGNTASTLDAVSGALSAVRGAAVVQVCPHSETAGNAQLAFGSLKRNTGATVLFRGTNLGANTMASAMAGGSNVSFATAPALSGSPGGTGTTMGIILGAYADTSYTGVGAGLATYDDAKGVRPLDTTSEYTSAIIDQQTQLDNVRYVRSNGETICTALTSGTTSINSLSIVEAGPTNTNSSSSYGVNITGSAGAVLRINCGVIYASQTLSVAKPVKSDCMLINVPKLDLDGQEGVVIVASTKAQANSNTKAPLFINSEITNDGGFGLTKGGGGTLQLEGSIQSTYTGDTVVNDGILYLAKTPSNIALPANTNLIIHGGTVYQSSNQIPDTANVTITGGAWQVNGSPDNGSRYAETLNSLTMTGGLFTNGQKAGGPLNILGSATLTGGTFEAVGIKSGTSSTVGSDISIFGPMSISHGAVVTLGRSGQGGISLTPYTSKLTFNGGLAIANTATGAYTPISIEAGSASTNGGRIILNSDVIFTGNGTNGNTTTIDAPAGAGPRGTIALVSDRSFVVGDGAAAADLTIVPGLADDATAGSLIKTGNGTMVLTGASTYSGTTTVNSGTLQIAGGDDRLPVGTMLTVSAGAALDLNGRSQTVAQLVGDGIVTNTANGTSILTLTAMDTLGPGVLQEGGPGKLLGLIKGGYNTLTLTAAYTYGGPTSITGGTLRFNTIRNVGSTLGSALGCPADAAAGQIELGSDVDGTSGTLEFIGSANCASDRVIHLRSDSAIKASGIGGAVLTLDNRAGAVTAAAGVLTLAGDGDGFINAIDSGVQGLTKEGKGTWTLTAANAYGGGTTVSEGTLRVTNAAGLSAGMALTIGENGTVMLASGLSVAAAAGMGAERGQAPAAVPEPSTLVLLGMGGLIVLACVRRRKVA